MAPMLLAQPASPIWDPCSVLGINPHNHVFTCVGLTKANLPCKNSIKQSDREPAKQILQSLSALSPERVRPDDLVDLANWLLCTRWHRGAQEEGKAREWYKVIRKFAANGALSPTQQQLQQPDYLQQIRTLKRELEQVRQDTSAAELQEALARSTQLAQDLVRVRKLSIQWQDEDKKHKILLSQANEKLSAKCEQLKVEIQSQRLLLEKDKKHEEREQAQESEIAHLKSMLQLRDTRLQTEKDTNRGLQAQLDESKKLIDEQGNQLSMLREELALDTVALHEKAIKIADLENTHSQQRSSHEKQLHDHQKDLRVRDSQLDKSSKLAQDRKEKLQAYKQVTVVETRKMQDQITHLKTQGFCHAFRSQVQLLVKRRKYDEVVSDNVALTQQHKLLQRSMSEMAAEMQKTERLVSPLKLQGITKGICTVLSVSPPRLRMKRLSDKGDEPATVHETIRDPEPVH